MVLAYSLLGYSRYEGQIESSVDKVTEYVRASVHILHITVSKSVFTLQVLSIKLSPAYHLFRLKARDLDMTWFKSGDFYTSSNKDISCAHKTNESVSTNCAFSITGAFPSSCSQGMIMKLDDLHFLETVSRVSL